jgi:hypothetical protein
MPKVTKMVNERFGGVYRNAYFSARKGDVVVMTDKMSKQIQADHKGLISVMDVKTMPGEGVVAEVLERAPQPKGEGDPEDPDANRTAAPRGQDRMFRGGHTK